MEPSVRLILALAAFVILILGATAGYVLLENMTVLEAVYMTVITVTTVGFREVRNLHAGGEILTIFVCLLGVILVAIAVGSLTEVLVAGSLRRMLGRKRMEKQIEALRDHFVVCGYGRIGHLIGKELRAHGVPFVVIDVDLERVGDEREEDLLCIAGDATEDETLLRAGIQRARGLVAALSSDAKNVFVTMSARELAPHLLILARAEEEGSERKLLRAGANRVVSPYEIGARRMAQAILRPSVMDFIELVTLSPGKGSMQLSEVRVGAGSDLAGQTLLASEIRARHHAYVVALKKGREPMSMNPRPDVTMAEGDVLIVIGPADDLAELERRANGGRPAGPGASS